MSFPLIIQAFITTYPLAPHPHISLRYGISSVPLLVAAVSAATVEHRECAHESMTAGWSRFLVLFFFLMRGPGALESYTRQKRAFSWDLSP